MRHFRPTRAEVDLSNLAYNFRRIKASVAKGTLLMPTVKADAYGHGLIPVSRKLVSCGADYLAVASIDEGISLRQHGIKLPILVLGSLLKGDIAPLFSYGLTPTVADLDFAAALNRKARALHKTINLHLKVDTGMGRLGFLPEDGFAFVTSLRRLRHLKIEGLFTHFAFADLNRKFTLHQIALFNRLIARLKAAGIEIPLLHAANSVAILDFPESHFNMVRPGLALYGLSPKDEGLKIRLKPVLSLKTKVVFTKRVPSGFGISYGHIYVTKRSTTIVVLPVGYGDGYLRCLSNRSSVLINGRRFLISGRVCMDQMMVDVGNCRVRRGDEAVLIGSQGNKSINVEELAHLAGTIPYEIVCGLGSRIPRVYKD